MNFKNVVKTFIGYVAVSSLILMVGILSLWPWKTEAGMLASAISLFALLIWGILGGFKNAGN